MFDGLSAFELLFIMGALAFGFGVVKFMISAGRPSQDSTSTQGGEKSRPDLSKPEEPPEPTPEQTQRSAHEDVHRPWHEVLGVLPSASEEEVRTAYRRKISQYHPDKVAGLGDEFSVIALKKSKEINQAYEQRGSRR